LKAKCNLSLTFNSDDRRFYTLTVKHPDFHYGLRLNYKESDMTTENSEATGEAQLRALIDDRVKAVRAKDIDGLMSRHAPGVLMFDALNPLQYIGSDTVRARAEEWFSWYQGPIGYEVRDLSIATSETVAFCHYLYRVSGTMTNGREVDMWVRATVGFRKIEGTWMVTHEHSSVPFDAESGRASLDLKP
jgi:ketosteroid isomerase-like protein